MHIDILGALPNLFTMGDEPIYFISDLLVNHYFTHVVRTGFEPVLGDTFATAHSDANFS